MKKFNLLLLMSLIFGALVFNSCNEEPFTVPVTDIDGNVYKTVVIGNQEWFAENLRTTRYNDGTAIPIGYTDDEWAALTKPAYAVYPITGLTNEEVLDAYGALYNWYAVNTGKLCPDGWHVPTDTEWETLITYAGGTDVAGGKLKSTRTVPVAHPRWDSPNTGATDEYGFSALPGGHRGFSGTLGYIGAFYGVGHGSHWWSSTEDNTGYPLSRGMYYDDSGVYRDYDYKEVGFSVRCLRGKGVIPEAPRVTAPFSNIKVASGESVNISFSVTIPGGYASANASAQGGSATISDEPAEGATSGTVVVSFTAGTTGGAASVTLTVTDQNQKSGNATAVFSNEGEEEKGEEEEEEPVTVTDIDGNVYKTVVIGNQEWFAENLRTTRYNDGTAIPTGHSDADWATLTTGAYAVFPITGLTNEKVLDAYGALYNWYAVNTGKLCPKGWHVPTDAEWTALTNYLGGETVAGGKLKSTRTVHGAHPRWNSPNSGATDEYGFSALPGGGRNYGGTFGSVGNDGYWWSSTEYDTDTAWSRAMTYNYSSVYRRYNYREVGFSVRCLRDK